jgi:hypothetical protein
MSLDHNHPTQHQCPSSPLAWESGGVPKEWNILEAIFHKVTAATQHSLFLRKGMDCVKISPGAMVA